MQKKLPQLAKPVAPIDGVRIRLAALLSSAADEHLKDYRASGDESGADIFAILQLLTHFEIVRLHFPAEETAWRVALHDIARRVGLHWRSLKVQSVRERLGVSPMDVAGGRLRRSDVVRVLIGWIDGDRKRGGSDEAIVRRLVGLLRVGFPEGFRSGPPLEHALKSAQKWRSSRKPDPEGLLLAAWNIAAGKLVERRTLFSVLQKEHRRKALSG